MPKFTLSDLRTERAVSTVELRSPIRGSGPRLTAKLVLIEVGLQIPYSFSLVLPLTARSHQDAPARRQDPQSFALVELSLQPFLVELPARYAGLSPNLRAAEPVERFAPIFSARFPGLTAELRQDRRSAEPAAAC